VSQERLVEVYCQTEDRVAGTFRTVGKLNAASMRNVETRDAARWPVQIQDGVQLLCLGCSSPLYFRDGEGGMIAAVPGMAEVCEDTAEVKAREARADEALRAEAKKKEG